MHKSKFIFNQFFRFKWNIERNKNRNLSKQDNYRKHITGKQALDIYMYTCNAVQWLRFESDCGILWSL